MQAYVFSCRNYATATARWHTSGLAGYPDDINNQFYTCILTYELDNIGLWEFSLNYINVNVKPLICYVEKYNDFTNINIIGNVSVNILKGSGDTNLEWTFTMGQGNVHLI